MVATAVTVTTIGPADVAAYRDTGYLVLRRFFFALEAAEWAHECERLWNTTELVDPDNLRTHVLGSERAVDRLDPVIDVSPVLARVAQATALRSVLRLLLGGDPLLFKDKLIFKPPGARGYRTHQDYAYWHWLPAAPDALLTVMVAVDGANAENGAVEFCPGLHARLLTPEGTAADVDDTDVPTPGELVETEPGDVVVFHSLTPHRSGFNRSASTRRQLYLSYSAAATGDLRDSYYRNLHQNLWAGMTATERERSFFR